jgi:hypothetical protein
MMIVDDVKCEGFLGECKVKVQKNTGKNRSTKFSTAQSVRPQWQCERSLEVGKKVEWGQVESLILFGHQLGAFRKRTPPAHLHSLVHCLDLLHVLQSTDEP